MSATPQSYPLKTAGMPLSNRVKRAFDRYAIPYVFIAVPLISLVVFLIIPMFTSLWWSLNEYTGLTPPKFVGLDNYIKLLTNDRIFIRSVINTTLFVLMGMSIGPTLGLLTALMLNQNVKFRSLFRTAYYLPVMTSLVVVSTIWVMLYNQNGLFNTILVNLGLSKVGWLSNPHFALISLAIAAIWQGFGFETVVFLAALQSIPRELYEAAMIDGAGSWAQFRYVTLPALRPVILFVYIIGVLGSFQLFDQVYVMTSGGPINSTESIVHYLFTKFMNHKLGYSSAIAYIFLIIMVIFAYLQMRLGREKA
jgi:ABC-type sugar transport system permease subunit